MILLGFYVSIILMMIGAGTFYEVYTSPSRQGHALALSIAVSFAIIILGTIGLLGFGYHLLF